MHSYSKEQSISSFGQLSFVQLVFVLSFSSLCFQRLFSSSLFEICSFPCFLQNNLKTFLYYSFLCFIQLSHSVYYLLNNPLMCEYYQVTQYAFMTIRVIHFNLFHFSFYKNHCWAIIIEILKNHIQNIIEIDYNFLCFL